MRFTSEVILPIPVIPVPRNYVVSFTFLFIGNNHEFRELPIHIIEFTVHETRIFFLCDSKEQLQKLIDVAYSYCSKWRLKANVTKSAVMVFTKEQVNIAIGD